MESIFIIFFIIIGILYLFKKPIVSLLCLIGLVLLYSNDSSESNDKIQSTKVQEIHNSNYSSPQTYDRNINSKYKIQYTDNSYESSEKLENNYINSTSNYQYENNDEEPEDNYQSEDNSSEEIATIYSEPQDSYTPCVRVGAICNDGSTSEATGRGACSYHGGVSTWLCE